MALVPTLVPTSFLVKFWMAITRIGERNRTDRVDDHAQGLLGPGVGTDPVLCPDNKQDSQGIPIT